MQQNNKAKVTLPYFFAKHFFYIVICVILFAKEGFYMGRILALDIGDVRIGLAISDLMGIIANPLETYTRKEFSKDVQYIINLAKEREVDTIVSGLPKNLNNQDSIQTQKVREFVDELEKLWGKKVVFVDERFTTASAQRVLLEGNVKRGDRKKVVDKVAATIILQTYLEIKK